VLRSRSKIIEAGVLSAQTVFIHGIQLSTTETPPGSFDTSPAVPPDPQRIVWIIILTLLLFTMGVAGIVEIQRRCLERQAMLEAERVPNDSSKPPTVASLCCPCVSFDSNAASRVPPPVRKYHRKEYLKAQCDDDNSTLDESESSMEMTSRAATSRSSRSPQQKSSRSSDSPPLPTPPSHRPSPPPLPPPRSPVTPSRYTGLSNLRNTTLPVGMRSWKRFRLESCDLRILEADILERYDSHSLVHTWECALCLSAYLMTIFPTVRHVIHLRSLFHGSH
jgi:hypothetical protein